jgi:hypothetical protein
MAAASRCIVEKFSCKAFAGNALAAMEAALWRQNLPNPSGREPEVPKPPLSENRRGDRLTTDAAETLLR